MKKLFTRLAPEGEWLEVVGMTYSLTAGTIPTIVKREANKPVNMEKCIKYFERFGMEWRVEG